MASASNAVSEAIIRETLAQITDPTPPQDAATGVNIVETGRVQGIILRDGNVGVTLDTARLAPDSISQLQADVEESVRNIAGVLSATIVLTAEKQAKAERTAQQAEQENAAFEKPAVFRKIKHVIAVASGKGGVGKSTVAANLALAFAADGLATGLLDADIYGPSLPSLFNIVEKPDVTEEKKLLPIIRHGVATMSIGYMIPPDQAMIWRGPMVQAALLQLVNDVDWPELDVLVIDLPPGTGDIQLTLAQRFPVSGAIIVTTPHALAVADVRRALAMFEKVGTPVLGLVENMAYLQLADGQTITPFGTLDLTADPRLAAITPLAQLPLDPSLQQSILAERSIFTDPASETQEAPTRELGQAFRTLSAQIYAALLAS